MPSRNSRALVCGGAGFIGEAIKHALVAQGQHEVTATLHTADPEQYDVTVRYPECDLTSRVGWRQAMETAQPDTIFMCAGVTGGSGKFALDPLSFVHDNLVMHALMFKAAAEHGVKRIVALSSTTGYPHSPFAMRETEYHTGALYPAYFNPGHTRRFIERLSEMYADKIETVWMRVSNCYGPGDNFDPVTSHVIAATVRKVAERQDPIIIWGDGTNVRDAVYIDDVVTAALLCETAPPGAYNFAEGYGMSVTAIAHQLAAHAMYEPHLEYDLTRPAQIPTRLLDTTKARTVLGWQPTVMMRDGLRKTLDWYESR